MGEAEIVSLDFILYESKRTATDVALPNFWLSKLEEI
jgi:hypothetical protein